jgi:long-chain acyl-CoA synthetase
MAIEFQLDQEQNTARAAKTVQKCCVIVRSDQCIVPQKSGQKTKHNRGPGSAASDRLTFDSTVATCFCNKRILGNTGSKHTGDEAGSRRNESAAAPFNSRAHATFSYLFGFLGNFTVTVSVDISTYNTFPKLLQHNAQTRGAMPSMREKALGIWQTWSWAESAKEIRALACGLKTLGCGPGDKLAIIGDNRPRLYWSMAAAQSIGAIPVAVYQDMVADELGFVLEHAEIRFAIAEDQEQVDKLLMISEGKEPLSGIIYDDPRGMRHYTQDYLNSYDSVIEKGHAYDTANPEFYDQAVAATKSEDASVIAYTSGTTGRPKGVVLSHSNVLKSAYNAAVRENLQETDNILAYLPMAWIGDHIFSYAQSYVVGFCVSCPESPDTVLTDLRELGPSYFFAPPTIYENLLTTVMIRIEDASWIKRKMFHYFMEVARRCGPKILDGEPVSFLDRILFWLGNILVVGPLKNTLGLSRVRLGYTAGEAIGPDIFNFYRGLGLNLKQLYGSTEASVFVTIQPDGEIKPDTVGTPAPEVELKIAENGEVLFRSPGVFQEYYKNPEATAETKTADGWVHTGDAGFIGDDGHLRIIDRAKDVGKLNNGSLFPPKYIENKLKFFPTISEAVTFGDGQDYVSAFINIDLNAVGNWAEKQAIPYASYQELAGNPAVYDMIAEQIAQVNADLTKEENMAGSQIHRFLILSKELDADDGELTRTRKVRRNVVADRYKVLIDALFSDQTRCDFETQVTFEDGRTDTVKAEIEVRTVPLIDTGAASMNRHAAE